MPARSNISATDILQKMSGRGALPTTAAPLQALSVLRITWTAGIVNKLLQQIADLFAKRRSADRSSFESSSPIFAALASMDRGLINPNRAVRHRGDAPAD